MLFDDLPRELLRAARHLLQVNSITLFVPSLPGGYSPPALVHEGLSSAPPELADLETAQTLHESLVSEPPGDRPESEAFDSAHSDCTLIRLSTSAIAGLLVDKLPTFDGINRRATIDPDLEHPPVWIGIRHDAAQKRPARVGPQLLTAFAGLVAWQVARVARFQRDSLTGLPDRLEVQARLGHEMSISRASGRALSIILIRPDQFDSLTDRVGVALGDSILCQVAERIVGQIRQTDLTARFASTIFAVALPGADATAAASVARKLHQRLTDELYSSDQLMITFSLGLATYDPSEGDLRPSDLILRADQALALARRSGGNCGLEWQKFAQNEAFATDSMSSVFTGEASRDARNMLLLSELVKVVSMFERPASISSHFIERLYSAMNPERVALFEWDDGGHARVVCGRRRSLTGEASLFERSEIEALSGGILERARSQRRFQSETIERPNHDKEPVTTSFHALPLIVGGTCTGCIYFEEADDGPVVDSADLQMLRSLSSYLAVALGRAELIAVERRRAKKAQRHLQGEVEGLRQAITESDSSHRSSAMTKVLTIINRVAATDVTVLVTGESGVGKGMVSRTIHQLSKREANPLFVVDCASIPPNLIESELFGHERGAFTGAQKQHVGRLRQAHRSTVFLDEIGELPLEIQGKLLRFVQERTVSPLGSTNLYEVDVRIIAATNRNLLQEVENGNFREDLYYRLNVVPISIPPLRQRKDEIRDLVEHFLRRYSLLYNRPVKPEVPHRVLESLVGYGWPGNIRELENRVQQAVVLGGDRLKCEDFGLSDEAPRDSPEEAVCLSLPLGGKEPLDFESLQRFGTTGSSAKAPAEARAPQWTPSPTSRRADPLPGHASDSQKEAEPEEARSEADEVDGLLRALDRELRTLVEQIRRSDPPLAPLGRWLETDLILLAYRRESGVYQRAAALLGLPSTTYRRRYDKAKQRCEAEAKKPETWSTVQVLVESILRSSSHREFSRPGRALFERIQEILLLAILDTFPRNATAGAKLLGVTPVTFRRRTRKLQASPG